MTSPYTTQPLDALMAAQTSVGLFLGALVWLRRFRPWPATFLFLAAIVLAVSVPVGGEFLGSLGIAIEPKHVQRWLKLAAGLAALGALLTRRPILITFAVVGEVLLWRLTDYIQESDMELAAVHLAFFGFLAGTHLRGGRRAASALGPSPRAEADRGFWIDDMLALAAGTAAGALVCRVVLHGWTNSGDEWANTFQAAVFAKLRAYGSVPHCSEAFRSFWVFQYMGRSFSQYTPGWPLFMAPFVALHAIGLAGPVALGLLAAGVSRLARRAAGGVGPGSEAVAAGQVRAAGWFAVLVLLLCSTLLINGGSRYPHVFVAATFAWAVEALLVIADRSLSASRQWSWGLVLGTSAGFLVAARPGDGCTLGIGIFLYFFYASVRGHVRWRAAAAASAAFGAMAALTLVILRLQVGRWFSTGYSLTTTIYPWVEFKWSLPEANEYKWGLPLATGAYCWWPCSPAIGLAGLAATEGRARRLGFIFFFAFVPFIALYMVLGLARGFDLGYGPRYTLPCLVPMAVGTGAMLARLWTAARTRWCELPALHVGGPAALALAAVFLGVMRIAPLVYPLTYADVQNHNRLHEALEPLHLHDAVVLGGSGLNNTDATDMTENLPLELYPNQDLLIAIDRGPEAIRCVRELYPNRTFFRAIPGARVQVVPF